MVQQWKSNLLQLALEIVVKYLKGQCERFFTKFCGRCLTIFELFGPFVHLPKFSCCLLTRLTKSLAVQLSEYWKMIGFSSSGDGILLSSVNRYHTGGKLSPWTMTLFAAMSETSVREIRIVHKTFSGVNFFTGINDTDQILAGIVTQSLKMHCKKEHSHFT
jgi:hypothetical protein